MTDEAPFEGAGHGSDTVGAPRAVSHYREIAAFFDRFSQEEDTWLDKTGSYHALVRALYRAHVPSGQRLLEIGCGRGDLLASLNPLHGVGVDVSAGMIAAARVRHPELELICTAGEELRLDEAFDYILLSDLFPFVHDLQALFDTVALHCGPSTRVIVNTYSNAWRPVLNLLSRLGVRPRRPIRNWVAPRDLVNLAELAGLEVVTERAEILLPVRPSWLSKLANGLLARLPGLRSLALTWWMIARPSPSERTDEPVSVIVPCRNEAGSIGPLLERMPRLGTETEIVFVEGHSTDDTREVIEREIAARSGRPLKLLMQSGKGKKNAVEEGIEAASHDIIAILDGDMTVPPEDLVKFYDALASRRGEMVNGTRLVYGMEPGAMRFLNLLGNKGFAWLLSFVLGQYVKDTLCGTKVFRRSDYRRMQALRHEISEEDPYGDFDLLLGASLLGLKVVNVPVRYGARIYGDTNIQRFSGGSMLLRLALAGYRRIRIQPFER